MTPAWIEPATFRIVVQHLNHYTTAVPRYIYIYIMKKYENYSNLIYFTCLDFDQQPER